MVTNVDAVTVFNGRLNKETRREAFIPTVIHGISYAEAKGTRTANNGVWSDDVQYKIRIPLSAEVQEGRQYLPDMAYAKQDDAGAKGHWTIRKKDMVIPCEYAGERPVLYEDELAAYAREQGVDLIHITEYADNTAGGSIYTRHWRIGGK